MKFLDIPGDCHVCFIPGTVLLGWSLASLAGALKSIRVSRLELSPASLLRSERGGA